MHLSLGCVTVVAVREAVETMVAYASGLLLQVLLEALISF